MVKGKSIVCPRCGRRFKTTAALTQHVSSTHAVSAPLRQRRPKTAAPFKRRGPGSMETQRVSGEDLLWSGGIASNSPAGSNFLVVAIQPQKLEGTRLQAHSKLWARWRPISLGVKVVTAGASTTFGSIIIGWSPEPQFQKSEPKTTIPKRIAALRPSKTFRLWDNGVMVVPPKPERLWYHTQGVADESSHGSIAFAVESPSGGYSGAVGVLIHLQWTVEFQGVELAPEGGGDVSDVIEPDSGWKHLFTTSDSSWDSSKLTFKMTSGGAMVPFSSAKENHIYQPSTGTRVFYKDSSGRTLDAKYMVPIQGFTTPGLALCATLQDAKDYIRSGDASKLLNYYSAGDWCIPDTPQFVGKPAAVSSVELDEVEQLRQQIADLKNQLSGFEVVPHPQEN